MFFNYVEILNYKQPDYFIFENVRNLLHSNDGEDFKIVLNTLGQHYNIKYEVLDSKDYGIPQTRRRLFIVGQHKRLGKFDFEFPKPIPLTTTVQDSILEEHVEEKHYVSKKAISTILSPGTKGFYCKPETDLKIARPLIATMHKWHRAGSGNYYHTEYQPEGKTNLRRLTPLECFKLQGFSKLDWKKVVKAGISNTQMYIQMGNTITVNVLTHIFNKFIPRKFKTNVIPLF